MHKNEIANIVKKGYNCWKKMTIENIKSLGFTNWQHLNIFYIRNTIYNFGQLKARIQKISWAMRFIILLTFICCSASAINLDSLSAFRFHYSNFENQTNIFKWFCCQLHFSGNGKILTSLNLWFHCFPFLWS